MSNDAGSDVMDAGRIRSLANLRPFKPGQSGNPAGVNTGGKRFRERFDRLQAELEAGGVMLTEHERVILDQAVRLSLRCFKDDMAAAQGASTVKRLLDPLYERRAKAKSKPAPASAFPSVASILARQR